MNWQLERKDNAVAAILGGVLMMALYEPLIASRFSGVQATVGAMGMGGLCYLAGFALVKIFARFRQRP